MRAQCDDASAREIGRWRADADALRRELNSAKQSAARLVAEQQQHEQQQQSSYRRQQQQLAALELALRDEQQQRGAERQKLQARVAKAQTQIEMLRVRAWVGVDLVGWVVD